MHENMGFSGTQQHCLIFDAQGSSLYVETQASLGIDSDSGETRARTIKSRTVPTTTYTHHMFRQDIGVSNEVSERSGHLILTFPSEATSIHHYKFQHRKFVSW